MSDKQNQEFIKNIMDEFMQSGSPAALLDGISDGFVIKAVIPAGTPISGEFRGREGLIQYLTALNQVMEILDVRDVRYVGSGSTVVKLEVEKVKIRRSGQIVEWDAATIFEIDTRKIRKILSFAEMSPIVDAYRAASH